MKDKNPDSRRNDLPPCPLSTYCLRLVDGLDEGRNTVSNGGYENVRLRGSVDELEDARLIERLRVHIPTCSSCTAALVEARVIRAQQRAILRNLLARGQQIVSPTTMQIMQAVRNEQHVLRTGQAVPPAVNMHRTMIDLPSEQTRRQQRRQREKQSSSYQSLRTGFSLIAVAAVIIISFTLFGCLEMWRLRTTGQAEVTTLKSTPRWSSVVMTSTRNGNDIISILDPLSKREAQIASAPRNTLVAEEVSHDGLQLLYSVFDGTKTMYYLRSLTAKGEFYSVSGKGGGGVWSTDDNDVFVSTPQGIRQINVQSKRSRLVAASLKDVDLWFYYAGYVYFRKSHDGLFGVLNRVGIERGEVQTVTHCPTGTSFWLGPGDAKIYYVCEKQGTFVVNSDGTGIHFLRRNAGTMIGYAADGLPLVLESMNKKYRVLKLGRDESQDRVLLDDVVPKGGMIPSGDVVVAPYGQALVARAVYNDNHQEIWYSDLTKGTKQLVMKVGGNPPLRMLGWSRIQVPEVVSMLQPAGACLPNASGKVFI